MKNIVINLERRPDRKKNIEKLFSEIEYNFYPAIDGKKLKGTSEIYNLFKGNDFKWRRGVIGCALSHYNIWNSLSKDENFESYCIFEDDITLSNNFSQEILNKCKDFVISNDIDVLFLGYHMFKHIRHNLNHIYNSDNESTFHTYKKNLYIGGFFGYIISKKGANKMLKYIENNGIKHGIDYLIKINNDLNVYECQPFLVKSDWVDNPNSGIDSDIQKDFEYLKFDFIKPKKFYFYQGLDSPGNDVKRLTNKNNNEMQKISSDMNYVAYNTLGFMKSKINQNLQKSSYYSSKDGIYIIDGKEPVYIQLVGGLCNQLFQIATTYAYSKRNKIPLLISSETQGYPKRSTYWGNILKNFSKYIYDKTPLLDKKWAEPNFHYDPIPQGKNNLVGYFQSSKYFKEYKEEIKQMINLEKLELDTENRCVIHIRRGDYMNNKSFHGILDEYYYKRAIVEVKKLIPGIMFDIFSDDSDWCKNQDWLKDSRVIDEPSDIMALSKIAKYKNFILSNSSFSWWGSWLADSEIVIAPDCWWGFQGPQDWEDIYEDHWIKVPIKEQGLPIKERDLPIKERDLPIKKQNWIFHKNLDSNGNDIAYVGKKSHTELLKIAENIKSCIAVNTLGFLKNNINFPLVKSPYFKGDDGIFIKNNYKNKTRIKLICNWDTSKNLCDEWNKMTKGNYIWNNLQFTWTDTDIDYYVIINMPHKGAIYDPNKTIIFQLEPKCTESGQNWGTKTWGEWETPKGFFHLETTENGVIPAYWLCNGTYKFLKNNSFQEKENIISHISSSKYFDPGHKYRIDFIHYLEDKKDIPIKIFGRENYHNFENYSGGVPDSGKELGIYPYKYYFMCENNSEKNYITEKLWEPILYESLCFYWGCPNVSEWICPDAFVQLDMKNFEKSYNIIKDAISNNLWEKRISAIRREKQKILDYYNIFPTIERILTQHDIMNTRLEKHDIYKVDKITGLAKLCDWFICRNQCVKLKDTDYPKTIFLSGYDGNIGLKYFLTKILNNLKTPFILILASEDYTFPTGSGDCRFNHYGSFKNEIDNMLKNPLLIRMFVENLDTKLEKLIPIPLGILNKNIQLYNDFAKNIDFTKKIFKVFVCHRNREGPQWKDRQNVSNLCLKNEEWKKFSKIQNNLSSYEFKKSLSNHTFVACVHGGGLDPSPKVWETLICGSIPIIKHSVLDSVYERFPVIFIDDWTEDAITENKLKKWFENIKPWYEEENKRENVIKMLKMDYWWKEIISYLP